METGTLENKTEVKQPVDSLAADTEAKTETPISDNTDEIEILIDEEGDQDKPKNGMTQEQSYAAFQKEKEKRKRKNAELEEEKTKRERLEREVEELKQTVGKISKGKPPEYIDFDTEDDYREAVKNYYAQPEKPAQPSKNNDESDPNHQMRDEAEFYLFEKEQSLSKVLPDYQEASTKFDTILKEQLNSPNTAQANAYLSTIAKQSDVDIAKAKFALAKFPELVTELAGAIGNQFAIAKVLERAANRVKTRSKQTIDTKPEPKITSSGPIDSSSAQVKKLRQTWVDTPTKENYNAYQAAKTKKVE